ncbi:MAG: creatininase family protein [Chitinispirillales bacterium]|nr:creatininase family protein [Chitinispirillales bacterium]
MNNEPQTETSVFNIEQLRTSQVRERIAQCPALILPLSGCEPFGSVGALGAESICVKSVADALSARFSVLTAPLIPYGCSTPFISFAGAAGVKPRTFINMLCEILHGYVFQGINRIFVLNAVPFNTEPVLEALSRLKVKYPEIKTALFSIGVGDMSMEANKQNDGIDRNDALILSLLAYLSSDMISEDEAPKALIKKKLEHRSHRERPVVVPHPHYKNWKKRGRDPQKLAALFPQGTFLAADADISGQQGKVFFERIIEDATAELEKLLCQDSK